VAAEAEPGPTGGAITALIEYDGALYFTRYTATDARRFWRFSGGTVQPVPAINNAPGLIDNSRTRPAPFVVFGGRLWYVRVTPLPERYQLWAFDGTSTVKVKALSPVGQFIELEDHSFHLGVYRGALYFGVVVPGSFPFSKDELWRVDAQGSATKVADLPGNASSFSQPSDFAVYKGKLYFLGSNFYRWDGSTVQGLSPGIGVVGKMTPFTKADRLFLSGITGGWEGEEPYLYDGNGVALVQNIMPDTPEPYPPYPGSFPTSGMEAADGFYFFAADQAHGRELWRIAGEATWTFQCDIVVAPIWVDKHLWVTRNPEVLVVTWLVEEDRARLVVREAVRVEQGKEFRVTALRRDTRQQPLPEAFGLVTLVFDRANGELLEQAFEIVADASPPLAATLHLAASGVMGQPSLKEVEAAPLERY
jgi:hypothetical protein